LATAGMSQSEPSSSGQKNYITTQEWRTVRILGPPESVIFLFTSVNLDNDQRAVLYPRGNDVQAWLQPSINVCSGPNETRLELVRKGRVITTRCLE